MLHGWRCSERITGQAGACEEGKGECMKYMRFMGQQEYEALMRGEVLTSCKDWKEEGQKSTSKGFCFFDCLETPEERLPYLIGVISAESIYCVIFREKGAGLQKSRGRYAKSHDYTDASQVFLTMNEQNMVHKTEYCAERYSNRTMVPIRTGKLEVYGRPWKREYKILWEDEKLKDEGKWKQET